MTNQLITTCYNLSIEYLKKNATKFGLLAASPNTFESKEKNYTSLFSRDIGVSSLGILASENKDLIAILKSSLISLASAQSEKGQFPFYFQPEKNFVRWWTPGALDSTLWWAIAFLLYYKKTKDEKFYLRYLPNLEKAFTYLTYQDTNNDSLLEQGEAADWADEMPRMGTVLYSNALWYLLVKLRIEIENKNELKKLKETIYEAFNTIFWVHKQEDNTVNYIPQNTFVKTNAYAPNIIEYTNTQAVYLPYYLGFVSHKSFEMRCDVYGNILSCLVGLADEKKKELIIDHIIRSGSNLPFPVKAMYPPIYPGEPDWKPYMAKGRQNFPWQYHNGGIWPYIGGFWVMLLAQEEKKEAENALTKLAEANAINDWEFNEYLHGQLGTPMGIPFQSWNMSMYIAAHKAVTEKKFTL